MELKKKMDAGAEAAKPEDALRVFEFFKQVAGEDEDLKEDLENFNVCVQIVLTDIDKKYWVRVQAGQVEYGEGEVDDPTFTYSTTFAVSTGTLFGEVNATSAYMAGDIQIEGRLQDAVAFQNILEQTMEIFEELTEDL